MKLWTPFQLPSSFTQFGYTPDFITACIAAGKGYAFYATSGAVAAARSIIELKNPTGTGKTCYVYRVNWGTSSLQPMVLAIDGTTITPASTPIPLLAGGAASIALFGTGSAASPGGSQIDGTQNINNAYLSFLPNTVIAIPPNHLIQLSGNTNNIAIGGGFWWIEL